MAETTSSAKKIMDAAINFLKPCSNTDAVAQAGFGAAVEYWECKTNTWELLACGVDIDDPDYETSVIETTGAGGKTLDANGNYYATFMPSALVTPGEFEVEMYLTRDNFNKLRQWKEGREIVALRTVGTDEKQTYMAFKAFAVNMPRSFPAGAEDAAMITATFQATGAPFYGELK